MLKSNQNHDSIDQCSIHSLTDDVLLTIFLDLSLEDIYQVTFTDKKIHAILESDLFWTQYIAKRFGEDPSPDFDKNLHGTKKKYYFMLVLGADAEELIALIDKHTFVRIDKDTRVMQAASEPLSIENIAPIRTWITMSDEDKVQNAYDVFRPYQNAVRMLAVNAKRELDGSPPLHWALENSPNLAYSIAEQGAALSKTHLGQGYLIKAAKSGNLPLVKLMLSKGANVDLNAPLLEMSVYFSKDMSLTLLRAGANWNVKSILGETPLFLASRYGSLQTGFVKALIAKGVNVNERTIDNETALIVAVAGSNLEIIRLLLDAGADVNAMDSKGNTALSNIEKDLKNARENSSKEYIERLNDIIALLRYAIYKQKSASTEHITRNFVSGSGGSSVPVNQSNNNNQLTGQYM